MEQIMVFFGPRSLVLFLLLVSCNNKEDNILSYIKYKIGNSDPLDTMNIETKGDVFLIDDQKLSINFNQSSHGEFIKLTAENCDSETILDLKVGEISDFKCGSVYPILGERISVLDIKSIFLNDTEYRIYKLFNESGDSYLGSSTTFWFRNTIALIKVGQGEYFELNGVNPQLVELIKEDLDFSELRPIPPAPPVPKLEDKN